MELTEFFSQNPRMALGFSGGADSSYLLYAAVKYGVQVQPFFVKTQFQTETELDRAQKFACDMGCALKVIELDVLHRQNIACNPPDRCYHCKKLLFGEIKHAAENDGYMVISDGTNASDDISDRPGAKALAELGILSPLRICGITKDDIRRELRSANLSVWSEPANACLATRIPTGTQITEHDLYRVTCSENALKEMGFFDLRVRCMGNTARMELKGSQIEKAAALRNDILCALNPYFDSVFLDLKER